MTLIQLACKLRPLIEKAALSLNDQNASEGVQLFPRLQRDGRLIRAGTRINWHGVIKRAAVDLWDTPANDPDHAPALWEDIGYRAGFRIAPDPFASTNAASKGECLWFGDILYRSLMDGNVFTPSQAPEVWEMV